MMKLCEGEERGQVLLFASWGRAGLTAERFVPNPYGGAGTRLYRSGDVARYRGDGQVEFLGRRDEQVKLRGYRIELGEVEGVLGQHEKVQAVVVVARQDGGELRLVAYIVGQEGTTVGVEELRRYAGERLPEYMVPGAVVLLERLPVTAHGKVDRRALPAPASGRPALEQAYVPPQTPSEERLVAIWKELLRLDEIGIYDNFFSLGGHSLLATQVMSRIRDRFQVKLPLQTLFITPTIVGLAEAIEKAQTSASDTCSPAIRRISREGYGVSINS